MPNPPKKKAEKPAEEPEPEAGPTELVENPMVVETIDDPDAEVPVIDNSFTPDAVYDPHVIVETIDDPDAEVPVIDNSVPPPEKEE